MKLHKWSDVRRRRFSDAELSEIDREVAREVVAMNLTTLRKELGLTQVAVAKAAEMTQGEISRLEAQKDFLVSTLDRTVRALGGELEVTAVFPKDGRRVRLVV